MPVRGADLYHRVLNSRARTLSRIILMWLWLLLATFWPFSAAAEVRVFVSIEPQKYFVEKIGGDLVKCSVMVPAASDPHTYEPKPRQMADIAKSSLYFAVGVDFEKAWLPRIAAINKKITVVHTHDRIAKIPISAAGRSEAHDHAGELDPHVWLAPKLVKVQASHIMKSLVLIDPGHEKTYRTNAAVFNAELDAMDRTFKKIFARCKNMPFIVFHPSWGYFAQAYGLRQVPIEAEGKDPKPAQLQALIHFARKNNIKIVFVQPQFSARSAEMVARSIGGHVVEADPMAEDWAQNLYRVAEKFKLAAQQEKKHD